MLNSILPASSPIGICTFWILLKCVTFFSEKFAFPVHCNIMTVYHDVGLTRAHLVQWLADEMGVLRSTGNACLVVDCSL